MTEQRHGIVQRPESDPFGRRSRLLYKRLQLLGARFHFESNSAELLRLVDCAYLGLPAHRLSKKPPTLRIGLHESATGRETWRSEPPGLGMFSGAGFLAGATDSSNFTLLSPAQNAGLVVVSPRMLRFSYHTRYELIEFAVYTLAAAAQDLVPLHAACVGIGGRGILLMGPSGTGKSTLALHCMLDGFDLLSEDSVFAAPRSMRAIGIANFLHVRADSLRWLGDSQAAAVIRSAPVIRRRSGVKKFEVDLRARPFRIAASPLRIVGMVFLSRQNASGKKLLQPISKQRARAGLADLQAYGTSFRQWREFSGNAAQLGAFELRRGRHPLEAVQALRALLTDR